MPVAGRPQPLAKPRGNCINPECAHPIKSGGNLTAETEGMRRANREGVCFVCKKAGFGEFQWTPELMDETIRHAMGELFHDVA
ncbi:hypothetical protein HYP71_gp092 [Arthrobacter phage KBurrousTX]|uniref:Uncharacterized protein n=1 Tax=Arthrobacter phage KBurrousTX TaxID=2315608 RepID=A0A386KBF0_9CAUD|nr:hypothetical protein HYP71_gp092 [Arthrobacter phage KBurrousTX]AYD81586.1 hypothetical protein KBurrousTX_92 [Arthrobacter phage KBurrousTX]